MDGLVYLLDVMGSTLAERNAQIEQLNRQLIEAHRQLQDAEVS